MEGFIASENRNPFRILTKRKESIEAFHFSVPVYTQNGKRVDLRWEKGATEVYYEGANSQISVMENTVVLQNKEIKTKVVFAQEVELEPTYNGVMIAMQGSKASFRIESDLSSVVKANDGCFTVLKNNSTPYYSVSSIAGKKEDGEVCILKMSYEQEDDDCYKIAITSEENCKEMTVEINLYSPKLIFDTTINQTASLQNNCFGGVAFLSSGERKEELYTRFNLNYINGESLKAMKEAKLRIPVYTKDGGIVRLQNIENPWCSIGMNWEKKQTGGKIIDEKEVKDGYVELDVTKLLKEQMNLKKIKSYGAIISNPNTDVVAISTGDNYYKPQILKIKYNKE